MTRTRTALAAFALTLALLAPVQLAQAASTVAPPTLGSFSARPLDPSGNPSDRTYFKLGVSAGQTVQEQLLVSNFAKAPVDLRVYPVDGVTGVTSGAVYTNAGVALHGAGLWLTLPGQTLPLAAGAHAVVDFTIQVPANATPGDHLAGVALESTVRPRAARGSFAIIEVIRAAVAVELRVGGNASTAITAGKLMLQALPGTEAPSVVVPLSNTGQLLCKPTLAVTLTAAAGGAASTTTRTLDTILPGDTIPYPLHWPTPLSAGSYEAKAVTSGCGPSTTRTASLSLAHTLSGHTPVGGVTASPSGSSHSSMQLWLIALVGGVGLLGGFLLARRRPRDRGPVELNV